MGRADVPLNEKGRAQARELSLKLCRIHADAVYTSPLIRARGTIAPYMAANPDIVLKDDERLIERDFGEWEDMSFAEIEKKDPERYAQWQSDFTGYTVPGGESSESVQERVDSLIPELVRMHEGETVFLVTHLGTARHIISGCLGLTIDESWRFTIDNASYAEIEYDIRKGYGVLKRLNA